MGQLPLQGKRYTYSDLEGGLQAFLDDDADTRWSASQKKRAINFAIRSAWPDWFVNLYIGYEEGDLEYDEDTFFYTIPGIEVVEKIVNVFLTPYDDERKRRPVKHWSQRGNQLSIRNKFQNYDGEYLEIHALARPWRLLDEVEGGDAQTTADDTTLDSPLDGDFVNDGVQVGDPIYIYLDGEWIWRIITEVTDANTLELHQSISSSDETALDYHIAKYTDVPYHYVLFMGASHLFELLARSKAGRDMEINLNLAAYYREQAADELRRYAKTRHVRWRG